MARTLKEAHDEKYKTHYLCKCEHCGEDIVVELGDFDHFYGVPEHETDERAWKCPFCGTANIVKNMDLWKHHCDIYGGSNLVLELTDEETKRADEFIEEHRHKEEFEKKGKFSFGTLGQQFSYEITPGGLGNSVVIRCNHCGATKDITEEENW